MKQLLYWIFLYAPEPLLQGCLSAVAFCRSICRVIVHFRLDVARYTGDYHGRPVTIGWIGTDEQKGHLLKMLYGGQYEVRALPPANLFTLRKTIAQLSASCDLVYVERYSRLPPLVGFLRIKPVLNTWMEVAAVTDSRSAHSTKARRRSYRRRRKLVADSQVEYRVFAVAEHPDQLRLFYDQLYAPHIAATYGADCVEPFAWMKIFYAKASLRLAYSQGEAISGSLFLLRGDTMILCKYGVRDPSDKLHRASGSVQCRLAYAEEQQIRYVSAFHVPPFLNDGAFRYKRTCGFGVQRESRNYYRDRDLYFRVVHYRRGVVDFLRDNPFVFERNGKLVASLLCDAPAASLSEQVVDQYKRYGTVGIDQYQFQLQHPLSGRERAAICQRCGLEADSQLFEFVNHRPSPPDALMPLQHEISCDIQQHDVLR